MKNIINALFISSLLFLISCSQHQAQFTQYRQLDFNTDWKFTNRDDPNASDPSFDVTTWRDVDLPHDWSIEDIPVQDSLHVGPFVRNLPNGTDVGYLRGGTGWYRKTFRVPESMHGKQVIIHFDGVQSQSVLYVNGQQVGEHVYGYTPFNFNITSYLTPVGQDNIIAMRVVNPVHNSRWFTGAGIYRNVSLSYVNPVHVDTWGVFIKTIALTDTGARLALSIDLVNDLDKDANISVCTQLLAPDEKVTALPLESMQLNAGQTHTLELTTNIDDPILWDVDTPRLYTARVQITRRDSILDTFDTRFGIRSIAWSAEQGFLLNSKPVLLKGACMHHDNGLIGAAAFKAAEHRRVRIMKENGYNAIRTSHNPPSQYFLNACDELGVLVIDESFDHWQEPKRTNDYSNYYDDWWQHDTRAMVLRDRNHPSVIMWSIGNEIQERVWPKGLAIGQAAYDLVKSLDDSRPITQAVCDFWDNKGMVWDDTAPAFAFLNIGGYNYQWQQYERDHRMYPERIMVGTESVPKHAWENWDLVKKHAYVIGDFVWTGMDYIGETGIGNAVYPYPNEEIPFLMPWPYYVSWCGDIDIIGNKKPQSFYRDVVWGESKLELLVHEPIPAGKTETVSFWGWPREYKSWNWPGHEGDTLKVSVYSSYPAIVLELNGKIIGEQEISIDDKYTATFAVPYTTGELVAHGLKDGKIVESKTLASARTVTDLILEAEQEHINADRNEILYIRVTAVDEYGLVAPNYNGVVNVSVDGDGQLLAAGNGSPIIDGSLQDEIFHLYQGRGLIVVRSTGNAGTINIHAQLDSGIHNKVTISVVGL